MAKTRLIALRFDGVRVRGAVVERDGQKIKINARVPPGRWLEFAVARSPVT